MPSPHSLMYRAGLTAFFLGSFVLAGCAQDAKFVTKLPAGVDFQLGGSGSGEGQFADLRDTTFDVRGNLWTLEGPTTREAGDATYPGNDRIQMFSDKGDFLRQFPLGVEGEPAHLAVDAQGLIYVSFPAQSSVEVYDAQGHKLREISVPGANGLTAYRRGGQNLVAAIGGLRRGKVDGIGGESIALLDGNTGTAVSLALSKPLKNVADLSADGQGNFYALADINSIFVFGPDGKLKRSIGAGTSTHASDGSEVRASVAVGSDGSIYSIAGTYLAKFDASGENVIRREGVFAWYEPWDSNILALDPGDHLWAASTVLNKSKTMERYHYRPVVLRVSDDFFVPQTKGVIQSSLAGTGLKPQISSAAPLGVAYDLRPFRVNVDFPAATRGVTAIDGLYRVYDARKNVVTQGRFNLPLRDGVAAKTSFDFTPPGYGAYSADLSLSGGGKLLTRVGANFGVTPPFQNLPKLDLQPAYDSRVDAARQMFAGLPALRLSVADSPKSLDALEQTLTAANRAGANVWVQFTEPKDATPDAVRRVVERFKGRIPVYEIVNEPDIRMQPGAYLDILRGASQVIRQVDPAAKIMGPDCVNVHLSWYKDFFDGGGAKYLDIVSFHDYEGNESIDEGHWRGVIGGLHDLMKQAGVGNMPMWQTERAIPAVRSNIFSGLLQAIRINKHDDILQSLGIPAEHNLHYYLNEGGYSSVPAYMWSDSGPHPAVFVTRTRYALTKGLTYKGSLDFGNGGNEFLRGLRYGGADGEVVALRTDGASPQTVNFPVRGAGSFSVVDAWGNPRTVNAAGGSIALDLDQLPIYVRVPRGASLTAPSIDLGRNIASQATFNYSGVTKSDFSLLTNGVLETNHGGLPGSNAKGSTLWRGELPDPGIQSDDSTLQNPPALSFTFPGNQSVSTVILHAMPPDNGYCALLDFDLQARRGGNWNTVASVRSADPRSEAVAIPPTQATSWATDTSNFVVHLPQPVTAREWRVVPLRTTFGLASDAVAARAMKQVATRTIVPELLLSEVEVYQG